MNFMTQHGSVNKGNPLGTAPVTGLIAKYAIPSILSMLVTAAYNITDQIFIGNVIGMLGNAATNVAFPTVTLTTAFAQMAGIGTAANFNIHMGKKQEDEAKRFLGTGITLMAALGILIMLVVFVLKRQILSSAGQRRHLCRLRCPISRSRTSACRFFSFQTAAAI